MTAMLLSTHLYAQEFSVSGTVNDAKTQQPLTGASVQVQGSDRGAATDAFGKFQLDRLPAGEYTLLIKFIGYQDRTEKITLSSNTNVIVNLEEAFQLTDEVVVYATRANLKTPTTFTNVSREALQKQNFGQDMPMLLNWTPSVVTTSDAGAGIGYTGMRIRGSDATRINVTINGIPYNDSESQGTFWVDIPDIASSTQSVQIQRGVGTSTNGAGSFGGSVNVQTLSQQRDPYTEVSVAGGSFNSQRYTLRAGTGLINNHWSFDGRVSKIKSDGYVDRASSDLSSYYLSGGYYGDKTILKFITFGGHEITYQSWNGIDGETLKNNRTFNSAGALYDADWNVTGYYDNEVDDYKQDHYQLHLTQKLGENWNANVSLHYTYGRGYYEQYKQQKTFAEMGLADLVLKDTTITSSDFITRKWLDNKFYGGTFSFNYEKNKTSLSIGGAYNQYAQAKHYGQIIWAQYASNSSIREPFYQGESQKNDLNLYVKWNYEVSEKVNVFADAQYRTVDYETAGNEDQAQYDFKDTFHFFNPKAGISYSVSANNVLYASYAVAHREPNRTDYVDGSVKPKSERLDNIEAGWRSGHERYSFEVNYYLMNYTDQLVLTGALNNVGNPIRSNVGKSYRTGVELSGILKVTDKVQWSPTVTVSVNKNKDYIPDEGNLAAVHNTAIILSPNLIAGSNLAWTAFKNFQATLLSKYVGKQYLDNTETESLILKEYFVNDLRFTYALSFRELKAIELSLLVNNVLDVKYESNGAVYDGVPYYFPQAGRNFMAMLTMKF